MSHLKTDTSVLTTNDTTASLNRLAEQIKTHPAYVQFVAAYHAMQADDEAQHLLNELRTHQYHFNDDARIHQIQQQLYDRPVIKAYEAAEAALRILLFEVDTAISRAAGIDFAAASKRSYCGG